MQITHSLSTLWQRHQQTRPPTALEKLFFIRQFAALLSAGIPIITVCQLLETAQTKPSMRQLIHKLRQSLLTGKTFAQSLRAQPVHFNELTCSLVQLGEHTGTLPAQLERIADHHQHLFTFKKRIKQALFYPVFILITALCVTLTLFLFVIPRFAELFRDTQVPLPWFTHCLFSIANCLQEQGWVLLCLAMVSLCLLLYHRPLPTLRQDCLTTIMRVPFIQRTYHQWLLARFARHLAITFTAGLPITDGLTLAIHTAPAGTFRQTLSRLATHVQSGLRLHQSMHLLTDFPPLFIQLVKTGEESGLLDQLLNQSAAFLEAELDSTLHTVSELLEPLIMLILGVVIGGLVIGLYLPIFKLGSAL